MTTDDVSLYFNPQFVETLSAAEIAGTLAHEVMHPALQHHTRRGGRNPRRWNMACDYAINPMLLDAGLTLPKDVLLDNGFRGMSAERIYNLLEEEEQNQSSSRDADSESQDDSADSGGGSKSPESGNSDKDNDDIPSVPQTPGGIGQVVDAPEPENGEANTGAEQARDWQIAVEQAENVAKLAGKLPAGVTRSLEAAQAARVAWRELLRRGGPARRACSGRRRWNRLRALVPLAGRTEDHASDPGFSYRSLGTFPADVPPYPVLWASTGKRDAPFGQVIPMAAA